MFEIQNRRTVTRITLMAAALLAAASASAQYVPRSIPAPDLRARSLKAGEYVQAPRPPGIRIEMTELDGPVFADSKGRTLYRWPAKVMRNGITGDQQGTAAQPGISNCESQRYSESSGLMSPYPGGLLLPDVETRPSCEKMWPPAIAPDNAKPVDDWSIVTRKDGSKQWAYGGYPLYTSIFDYHPGDVLASMIGPTRLPHVANIDAPAIREPVGPAPDLPPGFALVTTALGRQLVTSKQWSVYTFDQSSAGKPACDADCARIWTPILAPTLARARGDWSTVERAPGVSQWAYRGQPLYTYTLDSSPVSLEGAEVPGWKAVYAQPAPPPPSEFTVQDTLRGPVLADRHGKTVYVYNCHDDALDQLGCDLPETTQVYRLALCGGGDPHKCLQNWPLVPALKGAKSKNRTWSVIEIDPITGRRAVPGQSGALRVWAYRDRPIYTYAGDHAPGDANGDLRGEYEGLRQGFAAFRLSDDVVRPDALAASHVKDRTIGYAITEAQWAIYQSPDGKTECPEGLNHGPREEFEILFPGKDKKWTLVDTQLKREVAGWFPSLASDEPLPFRAAVGSISYGMNLDGKVGPNDLTSPEGERGIDNQAYRLLGCIPAYRAPDGEIRFLNTTLHRNFLYSPLHRSSTMLKFLIELSGVDDLTNDGDVTVTTYRGRDPLLTDADGDTIMPGGSQRIDLRPVARKYVNHWRGKIVDGVLMTESADVAFPMAPLAQQYVQQRFRGLRFQLKLTPDGAQGLMAGYADIADFYDNFARNKAQFYSYFGMSPPAIYHALHRLADAYPDPQTRANTAISSAISVVATRVFIEHSPASMASVEQKR